MLPASLRCVLHPSRVRHIRPLTLRHSPKSMPSSPPVAGPSKLPSPNSSREDTSRQKIHRAQVNTLLIGADRLLLTPRADTLTSYLNDRLSDVKFYNTYRSMAFMRAIRFCLQRHLFDVAISLYDRMIREGFVAVYSLCLRMTALRIVQQAGRLRETMGPLKKVFGYDAYDVTSFMDLVHYLINDKNASATLVDELAHDFVAVRGMKLCECPELVGEMASINMRAGRLDAAHDWLKGFEDACVEAGIRPDVTPYSDIVVTLQDIDPRNADAIQDVLHRMQSAGAPPDVVVFNSLIRVNLAQQRYQEAFALYDVLVDKRSEELSPNDVTFKMLFRAAMRLSNPRSPARWHIRPKNAVPPRRLFRDMIECHLDQTSGSTSGSSTVLSVSAFHLALRTFMGLEDYAAAFTLTRSLSLFGYQPNLQTYLIVFVSLLRRMKYEAMLPRQDGSYRLMDFLSHLGPEEDPDVPTLVDRIRGNQLAALDTPDASSSPVGIDTISHLLSLGEHRRPSDNDLLDSSPISSSSHLSPSIPRRRRQHSKVPSVEMLTGGEALVPDQPTFFSPTPLARILQKALLGELFRKAVHRGSEWDWKGAARSIIRETKGEMIPDDLNLGLGSKEMTTRVGQREGTLPYAASRIRRRRRSARGGRVVEL